MLAQQLPVTLFRIRRAVVGEEARARERLLSSRDGICNCSQVLLTILVDKMADTDKKVASRAASLLQKLGLRINHGYLTAVTLLQSTPTQTCAASWPARFAIDQLPVAQSPLQINQFMKSPKSTKRIQFATPTANSLLMDHRYRCVTVLNQTELRASESALAEQLINIYFDFFQARFVDFVQRF